MGESILSCQVCNWNGHMDLTYLCLTSKSKDGPCSLQERLRKTEASPSKDGTYLQKIIATNTQNPKPLLWARFLACIILKQHCFLTSSDVWWYFTLQLLVLVSFVYVGVFFSRFPGNNDCQWLAGKTVFYRLQWSVAVVTLRASWRLHDLGAMTWDLGPGSW